MLERQAQKSKGHARWGPMCELGEFGERSVQRFWGDVTEELPGEDGWVDGRTDRQTFR